MLSYRWSLVSRAVALSIAVLAVTATSGCGVQLRSGAYEACSPGVDPWLEQIAAEPVMEAPPDARGIEATGTVNCPRVPIVGVISGDSVVELATRYSTGESEEQVSIRLQNAAGLSDWSTFDGGGDCLMKEVDSVPSFLNIASVDDTFWITVRRGDASICFTSGTPNPGETAVPSGGEESLQEGRA